MSNDTTIRKLGYETCFTDGEIKKVGASGSLSCASDNDEYVNTGCYTEHGDSGGIIYTTYVNPIDKTTYISVIGCVHARLFHGGAMGMSGYEIDNWLASGWAFT